MITRLAALIVLAVPLMSCAAQVSGPAPIILFDGTGASRGSVSALRALLEDNHLPYESATSAQLDVMDDATLQRHQLLVVPGGNFEAMGKGISKATVLRIRNAVQHGLNYLGVCAGAFIAGDSPYNGVNLTAGVRFPFYSLEDQGVRKSAVAIAFADGSRLEQYWEDGPQLTGWGEVVARYPDGTPAITQGAVGKGWVVLTGTHVEAPESWRHGMTFATPARAGLDYAGDLVRAALGRKRLPAFTARR